jgi:HD superfamily phosphohydrolase YqeK
MFGLFKKISDKYDLPLLWGSIKGEPIDLPLETLSKIWVRPEIVQNDDLKEFCDQIENETTRRFVKKHLARFIGRDKKYLPLAINLVQVLMDNEMLLKHTMAVTIRAIKLIETTETQKGLTPELIIAALAHDIDRIQISEIETGLTNHKPDINMIAGLFSKHKIENQSILNAIQYHHAPADSNSSHLDLDILSLTLYQAEKEIEDNRTAYEVKKKEPISIPVDPAAGSEQITDPKDLIEQINENKKAQCLEDAGPVVLSLSDTASKDAESIIMDSPQDNPIESLTCESAAEELIELPAPIEAEETTPQTPQTREEILAKIFEEITPMGFLCFYYANKVYVRDSIIRNILFGDYKYLNHGDAGDVAIMEEIFGIKQTDIWLNYQGKIKARLYPYYIFDESVFERQIPEEKQQNPRDTTGKWLRSAKEAKKDENNFETQSENNSEGYSECLQES